MNVSSRALTLASLAPPPRQRFRLSNLSPLGRSISVATSHLAARPKHPAGCKPLVSVCVSPQTPNFHDQNHPPFFFTLLKDFLWSLKSLFSFLSEQPSQLKYIEWPSFNTTLKTATLSLVLVAVFIVALSSVDSALCYILALVLRKAP